MGFKVNGSFKTKSENGKTIKFLESPMDYANTSDQPGYLGAKAGFLPVVGSDNKLSTELNEPIIEDSLIKDKLGKVLERFCFSKTHLGFHYLIMSAMIANHCDGVIRNLNSQIYSSVAFKFNTTIFSVERNIRTAINKASKLYLKKNRVKLGINLTNKLVIYKLSGIINSFHI